MSKYFSRPSCKLRFSVTEKNDEMKGKIESEGPMSFTLEALATVIQALAFDPVEFSHDLHLFIKKEAEK